MTLTGVALRAALRLNPIDAYSDRIKTAALATEVTKPAGRSA